MTTTPNPTRQETPVSADTTTGPSAPGTAVEPVRRPVALGAPQADFDSMYRLAGNLARAQLLPQALRGKAADVLVIIMYGQELNLSPIQSIQGIYVVNGKPQLAGQLWLAKVREAGHRVKIEHGDGSCTTTITRGDTGESHAETFSLDDAKRAKLSGKDTYQQYPKRMIMWRSVSDCATVICPEVALGFGVAEITEDSAARGVTDVRHGGGSPLAGIVGAAAQATPGEMDAALAATPAAQPDLPAPAAGVVDGEVAQPGPSPDEIADAYRQMDTEAGGEQPPAVDEETDEEYQRRIWGDQYVAPADGPTPDDDAAEKTTTRRSRR